MYARRTLLTFAICLLLLPATCIPSAAQGEDLIEIEYEPEDLVMDPDSGRIHFDVTNHGTEPMEVAFVFRPDSDPSDLRFRFSVVNQVLAPARTLGSDLTVWRDDLTAGVKDDEFTVTVVWGADLEFLPNGTADPETIESDWKATFEILDEYPDPYGPWPFCILGVLVAVLAAVLLYPGWANTRKDLQGDRKGRAP